jgi:hypothetical protein
LIDFKLITLVSQPAIRHTKPQNSTKPSNKQPTGQALFEEVVKLDYESACASVEVADSCAAKQ